MSSGARVSIPSNVRKMIHNIKEVAKSHSEEEIYAMLKECSMDPNETAQKLLLQDTFHEVKRKRDRRKESLNNKDTAESRRPVMQGRGNRGGRGNYPLRYVSNDASGGRNSALGKDNGTNRISEKEVGRSPLPPSEETKDKEIAPATSSLTLVSNGPSVVDTGSTGVVHVDWPVENLVNKSEDVPPGDCSKSGAQPPDLANAKENPSSEFGIEDTHEKSMSGSSNGSTDRTQASSPGVYFSASDPVLVPSHDSRLPGAVGAIKREVGSQRTSVEQISLMPSEGKSTAASDAGNSSMQGNMPSKSTGIGKNQVSDAMQLLSSTHGGSSVIRPSSNYNGRLQQVVGPQKVGPSKEWKPKPTNLTLPQATGAAGSSEVSTTMEANTQSFPASSVLDSNEGTSKLQKKLEELHIADGQHVIFPNHIHVPEAEKIGFCFGSFDASFDVNKGYNYVPENDRNCASHSETSESVEEMAEQSSSHQTALATTEEGDCPDHPQSPRHTQDNLSSDDGDAASAAVPEYSESKQETALPPGSHQYSMIHTSPSYGFGFMPPVVGSQVAPFESSESQARDARLPSFVIPQPIDPASYYAQFYRSGADSDGRISPFHSPGVATKYNGNVAALSSQNSQSALEGANSLALSMAGTTPLVTQAAGLMQSSIAVTQQPLPVFRQPTGVPIAHYPPNYIPYGHYFSPFYVPPPAIHQFLSNGAFPQQPQLGSIYPAPPGASAKYSFPQYKAGTNSGNSNLVGVTGSYGPYGSVPAGYNPSSTSTAGNSTANDDLANPQFKESNVHITGQQQTDGSAVWIAPPGRDISGLQASSFYNIPPHGQVAFTPTQAGPATFTNIYHPAQAVSAATMHPLLQQSQTAAAAVDNAGSTASVYQQPQHAQINWPSNY